MEDGSYPMRVTLRLVSHNHVPDARYSAAAATAALAAANPALHGPAASAAAAAAAAGAAAAAACSAMSHPNRGVLLPLPPTLTALRSAAMDAARADPHFKALMAAGRTQRRRDRAALRRDQRKRRRLEASAVADEERQGPEPVAAATADGDADDEEEEGADSEDESTGEIRAHPLSAASAGPSRLQEEGGGRVEARMVRLSSHLHLSSHSHALRRLSSAPSQRPSFSPPVLTL